MPTVNDYLNLIPSQHRDKPDFVAVVTTNVSVFVHLQAILLLMLAEIWDVDTAVDDRLDTIGLWVGVSRNVSIPIENVYFAFDGDYTVGWDFGSWQPSSQPANIVVLPNDAYRTLIKTKIAANHWDGTTEGAYDIWEAIFTEINILIQDNQNMSYGLGFVGGIIDSLTLALITGGYIPLKPEGIRISEFFIPVNDGPLFGFDVENDFIQGFDEGSWAREVSPT